MKLLHISFFTILLLASACNFWSEDLVINCPDSNTTICLEIKCEEENNLDCLDSLKADGQSKILVVAHVPEEIDDSKNNITFTIQTDGGKFSNNMETITNISAVNGTASVLLTVGIKPNTYRIDAKVGDSDKEYDAEPQYIELMQFNEKVITFDTTESNLSELVADNESIFKLKVKINDELESFGKNLTLTINDKLSFIDTSARTIEVNLGADATVEKFIKVGNQEGTCIITAQFENHTPIPFEFHLPPALPEQVYITTSSYQISQMNGTLDITTYLRRPTGGEVSIGTEIDYEAKSDSFTFSGGFDPPFGVLETGDSIGTQFRTPADSVVAVGNSITVYARVSGHPEIVDSLNVSVIE